MTGPGATRGRARQAGALALVLALAVGACGGSTDDAGGGDDGPEVTEAKGGTSSELLKVPADTGEPRRGGTLTYYLEAETTGGYCLAEAQLAGSGIQVARTVYDTLAAPNADGEYVPFLAETIETPDGGSTWVLTIRDGITFHDGTALTAQIVKNNLDAYRGRYPARRPLLFTFVFANVDTVEVTGEREVTVTTKTPWPSFPSYLFGSGRIGMMAQAQLDSADECDDVLIGTGPFKVDSWTKGREMVLSRNDSYWRTDPDGNALPYLDGLTYVPIPNGPQRFNTIEAEAAAGEAVAGHFANPAMVARVREAGDLKQLESAELGEVAYLMLNAGAPPFDNRNARLALAHALDRDLYLDLRTEGVVVRADGPFAPGSLGYVEDTGYPEYDPELARSYADTYEQEAGQPLAVTITNDTDPEIIANGDVIQAALEDVGIQVTRRTTDQANLINTAVAGDYQAIQFRNHPGGDPDTQWIWWHSGLPTNLGRIKDPEIDRLLEQGRAESDPAVRQDIYADLSRRFASEAYNVWTYFAVWSIPHADNVNGVLGPRLPDGSEPSTGLATGHPVDGIWISE
ncbi:MAG: ABC transporter substrate-binding protein [Acidimicrobiia bacterium]